MSEATTCRERRRRRRDYLQLQGVALASQPVIVWASCACLDDVAPSPALANAMDEERTRLTELASMTPEERAERMRNYDSSMASLDDLCRLILQRLLGVARRAGDIEHAAAYEAALDGRDTEAPSASMRRLPMRGSVAAGSFA